MDAWVVAVLAAVGFGSSFIDSQVGGGGVISLPALILALGPGPMALGTNKLGGTSSALLASSNYMRKGAVPLRAAALYAPLAFAGGLVGVWAVLHKPDVAWLTPVIIVVMAAMAVYVLVRPRFGAEDHKVTGLLPAVAMGLAALDIGTYDGILGPGTGSLLIFALVGLLGYGFRRAAALGRVLNLASNVAALGYWAAAGYVDWSVGIPMALAMAAGGWVGSHTTLRHGEKVVKPLFEVVTLVLLVSLVLRLLHLWPGSR